MKFELWERETYGYHVLLLTTDNLISLQSDMEDYEDLYVRVIYENAAPLFLNNMTEFKNFTDDFYERKYDMNRDEQPEHPNPNTPLAKFVKDKTKHVISTINDNFVSQIEEEPEQPPPAHSLVAPSADAVNPKHYQNIAAGKQYIELMVDMLEGKTGIEAHLFGQTYKYLMRCGSKDEELQELKKALWYLTALVKYKETGEVM